MILLQTAPNPATFPLSYLAYSLLVILISLTALGKVARKWQLGRYPQGYRMIQGLTILSVLRLATLVITYIYWKIEPGFSTLPQIIDQAASLIGILIIFWLWTFPEPSREVDPIVIALMLISIGLVVVQVWLAPGILAGVVETLSFWQGISLTFLVIGAGLILIRKPNLWIYGLFMSAVLSLGTIVALISGDLDVLHLAELASYPLLLMLGDRFPIAERLSEVSSESDEGPRRKFSVDLEILKMIQRLFDEKDPAGILYKIAQATAYLILADLALVIDTPDEHGKMRIIAGYDLIREEPMQALTLDSRSIPLLSNYIQRGKLLHIPASSTSRDLSHLSKMLQISKPGHLLAAPVQVAGTNKIIGVVLFSPFSNRPWTKEDQNYITLLCKIYEAAFSQHLSSQDSESESVKSAIRDLTSQLTQLGKDKQTIKDEMAVLSRDHQNLLLEHDILLKKYENTLSWGNSLDRHLAMLVDLSEKGSTEGLRKYINVIQKEVKQARQEQIQAQAEAAMEPVPETEPEEIDPDRTRPADLSEAVQVCLESVQAELDKKGLKLSVDLPPNPPLLKMNFALFQEVFSFLVDNAIEDNKAGGEIRIRTQIYEEDKNQRFAHIKITDQGQGYFPDEIAAVLYEKLTMEEQEKLNQVMTNLFVTKNLVENEGGRMWVESKPGEGTTVSLLLAFLR